MPRHDRALASGLLGFVAILAIVALLYVLLDPAATKLFSFVSAQNTNAEAQTVIDVREQIWDAILFFGLFLAAVFIIARAVFESRRGI